MVGKSSEPRGSLWFWVMPPVVPAHSGEVGAIVVAQRALAVREIKPIHFPLIPLAVNRLPVMGDIFGVMQLKMIGLYRTSLAIRLGVALWNSETPSLWIEAKIGIEGTIFLAGNHDMLDGIYTAVTGGDWRMPGRGRSATCIEYQAGTRQRAKLAQDPTPRLRGREVLLQIHGYCLS